MRLEHPDSLSARVRADAADKRDRSRSGDAAWRHGCGNKTQCFPELLSMSANGMRT
jgi:hypothetical protein